MIVDTELFLQLAMRRLHVCLSMGYNLRIMGQEAVNVNLIKIKLNLPIYQSVIKLLSFTECYTKLVHLGICECTYLV